MPNPAVGLIQQFDPASQGGSSFWHQSDQAFFLWSGQGIENCFRSHKPAWSFTTGSSGFGYGPENASIQRSQ